MTTPLNDVKTMFEEVIGEKWKDTLKQWTGQNVLTGLSEYQKGVILIRLQKVKLGSKADNKQIPKNDDGQKQTLFGSTEEPPPEGTLAKPGAKPTTKKPATPAKVEPKPEAPEEVKTPTDIMPIPKGQPSGQLALTRPEDVDKLSAIMDKVNNFAVQKLSQLRSDDFVAFGNTLCLCGPGIDKFMAGMPLPLELVEVKELSTEHDKKGYPTYRYEATARNTLTGMAIPVYSEENAGKAFYCTRKNKKTGEKFMLPPDQVNLRDVRMAAHRGLRKEMIKAFFGLRGMKLAEAEEKGINTKNIRKVDFGSR